MTASQSGPGGRNLRSCLVCSIILTQGRFMSGGCPNCESYLFLSGRFDQVQECTSAIFEGIITLVDPEHSWVAKWQRLEGYVPGTYAVKVIGVLPDEVRQGIEDAGGRYVPRDGSEEDEL